MGYGVRDVMLCFAKADMREEKNITGRRFSAKALYLTYVGASLISASRYSVGRGIKSFV